MELNCPSCGAKHKTENHPGAFEIVCVCGYSLLVPDELALSTPVEAAPSTVSYAGAMPTSIEADDDGIQASPELISEGPAIQRFEPQALPGISNMTAPEDLPQGMVYDPFELPTLEPQVGELSEPESVEDEPAVAASVEQSPPLAQTQALKPVPTPQLPRQTVVEAAQHLIESTQLGSMGQYLGPSYELTFEGLTPEIKHELLTHLEVLIEERPWLETELRKRSLDAGSFASGQPVRGCPEILAVEIYLKTFELGGVCRYKLMAET
jgi:hypothetical protein